MTETTADSCGTSKEGYECPVMIQNVLCGARFTTENLLDLHTNLFHPYERCYLCQKAYSSVSKVNKHIRNVHGPVYECPVDGCDFKRQEFRKKAIKAHEATHDSQFNVKKLPNLMDIVCPVPNMETLSDLGANLGLDLGDLLESKDDTSTSEVTQSTPPEVSPQLNPVVQMTPLKLETGSNVLKNPSISASGSPDKADKQMPMSSKVMKDPSVKLKPYTIPKVIYINQKPVQKSKPKKVTKAKMREKPISRPSVESQTKIADEWSKILGEPKKEKLERGNIPVLSGPQTNSKRDRALDKELGQSDLYCDLEDLGLPALKREPEQDNDSDDSQKTIITSYTSNDVDKNNNHDSPLDLSMV